MKKSLLVLAGLLSMNVSANQVPVEAPAFAQKSPVIKLAVYDTSSQVPRDVGLVYSRSNKKQQLCWTVFNMPFSPTNQNQVIQEFTAPSSKSKFVSPNSRTTVSKDGKTHTLVSVMPASSKEFVQECWQFDNSDALGKYKLGVTVNGLQFQTLQFELVK